MERSPSTPALPPSLVVLGAADALFGGSGGTGTLNLNGGVFSTVGIWTQFGSVGVLNFNGGTLQAYNNSNAGDFITHDATYQSMSLNVLGDGTAGTGAVIDTNGFDITIKMPFLNGTGGGADGGLTKIGFGTLTLPAASTYTGPTAIQTGQLYLSGTSQTGSVTIQPAAKLMLANANPFTGATAAVSVLPGATLATDLIGGAPTTIGANANVTFSNKSV